MYLINPIKKQRFIFGPSTYIIKTPLIIKTLLIWGKKIYQFFIPHPFTNFYKLCILKRYRWSGLGDDYKWPLEEFFKKIYWVYSKFKRNQINKKISLANKIYFSNSIAIDTERYKELFLSLSLRVKDRKCFDFLLYPPCFVKELKQAMYSVYRGKCVYCGVKFNFSFMQIDHVIPKRHGGPDNLLNYVLICSFHNSLKRDLILQVPILEKILTIAEKKANKIYIRLTGRHLPTHKKDLADIRRVYG